MADVPGSQSKPTILVVDDAPDNLSLMSSLLKDDFRVKVASNGEKALKIAQADPGPDLILLDIMMPGMDGYEVCQRLMADPRTHNIPVIFLTARSAEEDEQKGLEIGAVDYVSKPISPPIVKARIRTQLALKAAADFLRDKNAYLEQEVQRRIREIAAIQEVTILAMAALAETRDADTGYHIRRTQLYIKTLALKLRNHPRFSDFLNDENMAMLFKSAPLHDIGKVGVPDRILLKPGRLTPEEFETMKTHAWLGWHAIDHAEKVLGHHIDFLKMAKEIALCHHEKWDGTGYPQKLSGNDIPISARLMALADVYDAIISRRVYKDPVPQEQAVQIILAGKGTHFDPDLVDAFAEIKEEFQAIAGKYSELGEHPAAPESGAGQG
jgi:putative two-component system response regulator